MEQLTALFNACFRIQREACEATRQPCGHCRSRGVQEITDWWSYTCPACKGSGKTSGRYIPMVVENVRGAQPWVGRAKANYGSFYLWGDVEMVGDRIYGAGRLAEGLAIPKPRGMKRNPDGTNHPQGSWFAVADSKQRGLKQRGRNFHFPEKYGIPSPSFHGAEHEPSVANAMEVAGASISRTTSSRSLARKAASAQIAKIPYPLSSFIARTFRP